MAEIKSVLQSISTSLAFRISAISALIALGLLSCLAPQSGDVWASSDSLLVGGEWSQPIEISDPQDKRSRWADIATDPAGNVHVVWVAGAKDAEAVFYSRWDGQAWSAPVDIFFTVRQVIGDFFPPEAWVPQIAADQHGKIHVTWSDLYHLFYGWSWANSETWKAAAWYGPTILATNRPGPYSDVAVDSQGNVHVVYNGLPEIGGYEYEGKPCLCHDAYYLRSADGGATWSKPIDLFPSPQLDNRIRITIDDRDFLHVAWDANNDEDNQKGLEPWERGVYIRSTDRGLTWENPQPIVYDGPVRYPRVAYSSAGRMLLTWIGARMQKWSADSGLTWGALTSLPAPVSREANEASLDTVTDNDGNIHLVLAGHNPDTLENDIYYLVWAGQKWSAPVNVSKSPGLESVRPKIAISLGNVLHVVWEEWELAEKENWNTGKSRRIYYSTTTIPAAPKPAAALPTPISTVPPGNAPLAQPTTQSGAPTSTPSATSIAGADAALPGTNASRSDWVPVLLTGAIPVVVLVGIVVVVRSWANRR